MRSIASRFTRTRVLAFGAIAAAAIAIACSVPAPDRATGPDAGAQLSADLHVQISAVRGASKGTALIHAPAAQSGTPMNAHQTYYSFQVEKQTQPVSGNPTPTYPSMLESARVDGEVLVQFVVDTMGQVDMSQFKVLKASNPLFTDAVTNVLPKWKFYPAEVGGHKVKQLVQMPLTFKVP